MRTNSTPSTLYHTSSRSARCDTNLIFHVCTIKFGSRQRAAAVLFTKVRIKANIGRISLYTKNWQTLCTHTVLGMHQLKEIFPVRPSSPIPPCEILLLLKDSLNLRFDAGQQFLSSVLWLPSNRASPVSTASCVGPVKVSKHLTEPCQHTFT